MKKQLQVIVTVPNQLLREVTKPVTNFGDELKDQSKLMIEFLRNEYGVGLAANQIGFNNSVFVVEFQDETGKNNIPLQFFVNPEIVEYSKEEKEKFEGCLSIPKIELPITRPEKIKVKAQDLDGKKIKITAKGLLARIIQHETDHLHGKVFTDLAKEKLHRENPDLKNLKVVYIGTGAFSEMVLRGLILLGINIVKVITETEKPSGRKNEICKTPVAETAIIFKKNISETEKISELKNEIEELNPDLILLADFGQLIPNDILSIPKIAAINIHPSLLPKFRGSSPIQSALLSNEKETGVTIMKMAPKIDAGEILMQEVIEIDDSDNAMSMRDLLANLSLKMLTIFLPKIQKGEFKVITQDETKATFTRKFTKTDGEIDWQKTPKEIDKQIRALFGWPGTYTTIDSKRLIIHQAHVEDGKLALDVVQPEGKSPMIWNDFLRGYKGENPDWFKKIK